MLKLGGGMLGQLLAADPGYRGPRADCGQGHEAEFTDYRDKTFDTVLGPVTLRRAWYHCAECRHGFAPRDAELGVAGASLSPGLAAMTDTAAAAGPFAKAAGLLASIAHTSDDHGGVEIARRTRPAPTRRGQPHPPRRSTTAAAGPSRPMVSGVSGQVAQVSAPTAGPRASARAHWIS
jgi:hypothetical protein